VIKYPGIKKYAKWVAKGVAASAGAVFIYKKFLADYLKSCKEMDKEKYKNCIKKIKIKANQEVIIALKSGSSTCNLARNPKKCKEIYKKQIEIRKKRISKLRG
jgi:hypothetical protein